MRTLPSGILIGHCLMLRLKMSLDFSSLVWSLSADMPRGLRNFSGHVLHDSSGALEQVEFIYEANLEDAIRELDLQEFGDEEAQKALRTLLLSYLDLFSVKTSTLPGFEFGLVSEKGGSTQRTLTMVNHKVAQRTKLIQTLPQTRCVLRCRVKSSSS
jgi:hypothetical protein